MHWVTWGVNKLIFTEESKQRLENCQSKDALEGIPGFDGKLGSVASVTKGLYDTVFTDPHTLIG